MNRPDGFTAEKFVAVGSNMLGSSFYGPRDNFDLPTSHVIPALIRKCVEAKEEQVMQITLWGDGSPTSAAMSSANLRMVISWPVPRLTGSAPS
jgi:GDP-L-fucose synthase